MREAGTAHWLSPNTGADNSSGFTALPSGMRSEHDGGFVTLGNYGDWWSATPSGPANAWARYLYYNITAVVRTYWSRNRGYSVRCVKD